MGAGGVGKSALTLRFTQGPFVTDVQILLACIVSYYLCSMIPLLKINTQKQLKSTEERSISKYWTQQGRCCRLFAFSRFILWVLLIPRPNFDHCEKHL